jgi:hypothetical protein
MNKLRLIVSEELWKNIMLRVGLAKGEIGWIGEVFYLGKSDLRVGEIYLIEQNTTPDNTKLVDDAYAKFVMGYYQSGKDVVDLKLWIHSHGDLGVCWSPDDEKTIETHKRATYFVSIVVNKRGRYLVRVDIFNPLRVTIEDVELVIIPNYPPEEVMNAREEIERLVHFTEPKDKAINAKDLSFLRNGFLEE